MFNSPINYTNDAARGRMKLNSDKLIGQYRSLACTKILPNEYKQLRDTGRLQGVKGTWHEGSDEPCPHFFWDSDIAKWIEAAAYAIESGDDASGELERQLDEVCADYEALQMDDGYVNSHYCVADREGRYTNTMNNHELYTIGHLTEAAVAYYKATGKRQLLDVMIRAVDHAMTVFGDEEGKLRGYPGHEEIELALYKLYRVTNDEKYIKLLRFFIDERGKRPYYWDIEAERNGSARHANPDTAQKKYSYYQADRTILEQDSVNGHAVRAMYLYAGATDLAVHDHDEQLMAAVEKLWTRTVQRRMYITGAVGSTSTGEAFTYDYDLPNEMAYNESCASIGLMMWSQRMLKSRMCAKYSDVVELALFNTVMGGVSQDGAKFLYANPLLINKARRESGSPAYSYHFTPERQPWFGCACCPPNIARIFTDITEYCYDIAKTDDGATLVCIHQYADGVIELPDARVVIKTDYPWDGKMNISVEGNVSLAFRIPGWSRVQDDSVALHLKFDGVSVSVAKDSEKQHNVRYVDGYMYVDNVSGDMSFRLPMPVETVYANPKVIENFGKVAIMRGPIVYCLEQMDNTASVHSIEVGFNPKFELDDLSRLPKGAKAVVFNALAPDESIWQDKLYSTSGGGALRVKAVAIPFYARLSGEVGDMTVWIKE